MLSTSKLSAKLKELLLQHIDALEVLASAEEESSDLRRSIMTRISAEGGDSL
jgi:hypothetical protein